MYIGGNGVIDRLRALYAFLFGFTKDGVLRAYNYAPGPDDWEVGDPRTGMYICVQVTGRGDGRRLNIVGGGIAVE